MRPNSSRLIPWFLLLAGGVLRAQSVDTGILGVVTDASGGAVAGATVTITQPAT